MGRKKANVEEVIPNFSIETRDKVLKAIKEYGTGKFPLEDARGAIAYSYSLLSRVEEQYDALESLGVPPDPKIIGEKLNILRELSMMTKRLVGQMGEHQKILESKKRQEFISIQEHAAVLDAMITIFTVSLIQEGLTEGQRVGVFTRFKELQQVYPVVETDLEIIKKRLFGTPEEINILPSPIDSKPTDKELYAKALDITKKKIKKEKK